jgi:predicted RecA/RadA family phage recombinase
MKNFIQKGEVYPYIVPTGQTVTSGQIVVLPGGQAAGVAVMSAEAGEEVAVNATGVYELERHSTTGDLNQGAEVFVDSVSNKVTTAAAGNAPLGLVFRKSANGATKVQVFLAPKRGDSNNNLSQAANVAALGAQTAIPAASMPAAYDQTQVETAVDDVADAIETRLAAAEAKIDELIAALIAAGLMA